MKTVITVIALLITSCASQPCDCSWDRAYLLELTADDARYIQFLEDRWERMVEKGELTHEGYRRLRLQEKAHQSAIKTDCEFRGR